MRTTKLIIVVSTARTAMPIIGATITVIKQNTKESFEGKTNESGRVILKFKEEAAYHFSCDIKVQSAGYQSVIIQGCLVYEGMETLESISISPLPISRKSMTKVSKIKAEPPMLPYRTDKKGASKIPTFVTVHFGSVLNDSAKNRTILFEEYVKKIASYYLISKHQMMGVREQIRTLIRFLEGRIEEASYKKIGKCYDLTNQAEEDVYFEMGFPMYQPICEMVEEVLYEKEASLPEEMFLILKKRLNRIKTYYSFLPRIIGDDSIYTTEVQTAVLCFQEINFLSVTGIVEIATWKRIERVYESVERLLMLQLEERLPSLPSTLPKVVLTRGCRGVYVRLLQYFLRMIATFYEEVRLVEIDGIFGNDTYQAILDFQHYFELMEDGLVGPLTWDELYNVYLGIVVTVGIRIKYPGYLLKKGCRGDHVYIMQEYLREIRKRIPLPELDADGAFGPDTLAAVIAFQEQCALDPDGIIGRNTWERIVSVRLLL